MLLELSDHGEVQSSFCSCHEVGDGLCEHLQALHRQLLSFGKPYHKLYELSIWKPLFVSLASEEDYIIDEQKISLLDEDGSLLFELELCDPLLLGQPLKTWTQEHQDPEVYRAFQWGALSPHDRQLYKYHRASVDLRFELSLAGDLAKALFRYALERKIDFEFHIESLDHIAWKSLGCRGSVKVAAQEWQNLLPHLAWLKVEPPVFAFGKYARPHFHYEIEHKRCVSQLKIDPKSTPPQTAGMEVEGWTFWPGFGFWPHETHPLIQHPILDEKHIEKWLDEDFELFARFIDQPIDPKPHPCFFEIWMDVDKVFHIRPYLEKKGDLDLPGVALFGDWIFIPDRGFLLVQDESLRRFGTHTKVYAENIDPFLIEHKHWISRFEGFAIHLFQIEFHLSYRMEEGGLRFCQETVHDADRIFDLGGWIYVKGQGFFHKQRKEGKGVLYSGRLIPKAQVGLFLEEHQEELRSIAHFFGSMDRLSKLQFYLTMLPNGDLEVLPYIQWNGPAPDRFEVFGRFLFIEKEGFYRLPISGEIPESFFHRTLIASRDVGQFLKTYFPLIRPLAIRLDPRLSYPERYQLSLEKAFPADEPGVWTCSVWLETEKGKVSLKDLISAFCRGETVLLTRAGLLDFRLEPLSQWLEMFRYAQMGAGDGFTLSALQWMKVAAATDWRVDERAYGSESAMFFEWLEGNCDPKHVSIDLAGFESELRPYQLEGVRWLFLLYSLSLSGFLCDEMGLGKTHQAMGLIAALLNAQPDASILIVAPTSVIYHWQHLLQTFLPTRGFLFFHGRMRAAALRPTRKVPIVLTSYGLLRTAQARFQSKQWNLIIFDETQVAKNRQSQIYKCLQSLNARSKIALTGTPFENHLWELKGLFQLLLPNYLPSDDVFKQQYLEPISRRDAKAIASLRKLIHPFILRRKKSEVLAQLPEKIEHKYYVELSAEQKELYAKVFEARHTELMKEGDDGTSAPFFTHVFALLTCLKQICDHPALFTKDFNPAIHSSEKWDFLFQVLEEALETGQKVAIFSQYVEMLSMIAKELERRAIQYALLTGVVKDRKEQVDTFQTDPNCKVFLGSILAAGVGIDLTAASVLVHYDRWWNPAKEEQATARIHRFGQTRGVQIYKLIAKNSIEEHLDRIIERKLNLYTDLLEVGEEAIAAKLGRAELLHLLDEVDKSIKEKF